MRDPLSSFVSILSILSLVSGLPAPLCTLVLPGRQGITGSLTPGGACRYTVRYGQATRWEEAIAARDFVGYDARSFPPGCPQTPFPPSGAGRTVLSNGPGQSEDCLFAVVYISRDIKRADRLPVFVWVHGGSFYAGAASAPGLDGTALAVQGKMIVMILQYRLGVLGLLPPASSTSASDPNLALKDVILALQQVQNYAEWIGGNRALLNAPQAKGLFRAAILQSDPITYGTAPAETTGQLRELFYAQPRLVTCSDIACLRDIPVSDLLSSQERLLVAAPSLVPGAPIVTPLRPTHNTPSLPSEPTSQTFNAAHTLSNPPGAVSVLITTTANEAGQVVQSLFPQPVPADNATMLGILSMFVGVDRAQTIIMSPEYAMTGTEGPDEFRHTLERLVTDGVWRCANRDFAGRWAAQGGNVWVGEWTKGVSYISNQAGGYCSQGDRVCHEDDIFPTFDSASQADAQSRSLQNEVLARWAAFIHDLDPDTPDTPIPVSGPRPIAIAIPLLPGGAGSERGPSRPIKPQPKLHPHELRQTELGPSAIPPGTAGPPGQQSWARYNGEQQQVFVIGGGDVQGCPADFWGQKAKYDWQLFV